MFKAVKRGKIRFREDLVEVRPASVIKLNEDFLTAAVFSRLLYLPAHALARILPACDDRLGSVVASTFWPRWTATSTEAGRTAVEPDVYIEFEGLDLIVEAKLNDIPGCHRALQWAWEWAAWHESDYFDAKKPALLLAIGGLGVSADTTKSHVKETAEAANHILRTEFPAVPAIRATGISWRELYTRLTSADLGDVNSQIL